MSIKVSPSILAADFGNIEKECNLIDKSGADWFHLDVMDEYSFQIFHLECQ